MRTFKAKDRFGAEVEFILKEAGMKEITEADIVYRIAYSQALKDGILPREKMKDLMRHHEIWSEEDDKILQETIKEIAKAELTLKESESRGDQDKCIELSEVINLARVKMWKLFLIQQNTYTHSCEGYADTVKQESLMAACVVVKANGVRYWKNYKEYVVERDENDASEVPVKAMESLTAVLNSNKDTMLDSLPESKWLKEAKRQMLEDEISKAQAELTERVKDATEGLGSGANQSSPADSSIHTEGLA